MNGVVAVVLIHVIDLAVEDEPATGDPLCYAPRYRPEVRGVILFGQRNQLQKIT